MAEAFGVNNSDAVIKLAVSAMKQTNRCIFEGLLVFMKAAAGWSGREDSTSM